MINSLKEIYSSNSRNKAGHGDKGTIHSYIDFYEKELFKYQHTAERVLEIGIAHGLSTNMWRKYFINAEIIGVDIKDRGAIAEGCTLIYADATNHQTFSKYNFFDVIIDDGSHIFEHQIKSFNVLFPKLRSNGVYFIEDIQDIDKHRQDFLSLAKNVEIFDFRKNKNRYDDVIVKIIK